MWLAQTDYRRTFRSVQTCGQSHRDQSLLRVVDDADVRAVLEQFIGVGRVIVALDEVGAGAEVDEEEQRCDEERDGGVRFGHRMSQGRVPGQTVGKEEESKVGNGDERQSQQDDGNHDHGNEETWAREKMETKE